MAYAQISQYGMNDKVGNVSFPEGDSRELGKKPYSKRLQHIIDQVGLLACMLFKGNKTRYIVNTFKETTSMMRKGT